MKKMMLLLVLGLMSFQTVQNDPAAEKLLDRVSKKFQSYKSVYIEFDYNLHNPDAQIDQETNGRVSIKGSKYHAEYEGVIDIFDGQKRYLIIPENKEVNISTPEKGEGELTPAHLFDFFKEGYRFKMDIKQHLRGRTIQYVRLLPVDENNDVDYVLLGIDAKTYNIYKVIIVQKDKTRITIRIRKFDINKPFNDQMFKFDKSKYAGYTINDLD